MKRLLTILAGLGAAIFVAPSVWAQVYTPGTGISGTPHDFAGLGGVPPVGLCTFCHTPHQAQTQELLWNRPTSSNTFSWAASGVTATVGGTDYPTFSGDTYTGPTAKCLSCHDGSVAIGDIGWWNGGDPGVLSAITVGPPYQIGGGGDMTGNHPVAMPFPYLGVQNTYNGVQNGVSAAASGWQTDPEAEGIKLYNDSGGSVAAGVVQGSTGIECTSCHDPHNGTQVEDIYFLRGMLGGPVAGGYICTKCHDK